VDKQLCSGFAIISGILELDVCQGQLLNHRYTVHVDSFRRSLAITHELNWRTERQTDWPKYSPLEYCIFAYITWKSAIANRSTVTQIVTTE